MSDALIIDLYQQYLRNCCPLFAFRPSSLVDVFAAGCPPDPIGRAGHYPCVRAIAPRVSSAAGIRPGGQQHHAGAQPHF